MERLFKYGFEIKPAKMKIWHVVKSTNEDKTIKELELQITYNPAESEPYDTKLIVQDNQDSINFAILQLDKAIYSFKIAKIMTYFDKNNNIDKYEHISQKGVKNGN